MKYKLMDLCNGITDGSHNPPTGGEKSDYLMISSKNVFDDQITLDDPRFLSREQFEQEDKRTKIKPGDVLMTIVGTVGRTAVVSRDIGNITLQRSVAVLHVNEEICYSRYLMYLLRSKKQLFDSEAHGVAQKGIYLKQLSNTYIDIPDRLKQLEVINILDRVQYLINERTIELSKLDKLIKARFVEIMVKSDLGGETTIESITKRVKVGFVGTCEKYYTDESGIPMLRTGNITEKGIDLSDLKYVTAEFHNKNQKSQIHAGDVLIARHGSNGQANVYFGPDAQCLNAVVIVPDQEIASSVFLAGLINSPAVKRQIERTLVGSTQHVVNTKSIAGLFVRIPNMDVQKEYESFVMQVDKSKRIISKGLDESVLLFNSLMQRYFG